MKQSYLVLLDYMIFLYVGTLFYQTAKQGTGELLSESPCKNKYVNIQKLFQWFVCLYVCTKFMVYLSQVMTLSELIARN